VRRIFSTLYRLVLIASLGPQISFAANLQWNGFGNIHAIKPLQSDIYQALPESTSGRFNFTDATLLGLNLRADLGDGWSVVTQLVTGGTNIPVLNTFPDWKPRADWFYVAYQPFERLTLKFGRQICPIWLTSEFFNVGFTYPWMSPPVNVYGVALFRSFNGVSVEYRQKLASDLYLTGTLYGGSEKLTRVAGAAPQANVEVNNLLGSTLTLDGDGWRIRASAARAQVYTSLISGVITVAGTTGTPLVLNNVAPLLIKLTLGARYDKNRIVAYGEYGMFHSYDSSIVAVTRTPFLYSMRAGYGAAGYRFGKFLPWYMFSSGDWNMGIPNTNGMTNFHSLGLNYQASNNIITKLQFDRQTAIGDADGLSRVGTADKISAGISVVF
jgi:hypothetical protein